MYEGKVRVQVETGVLCCVWAFEGWWQDDDGSAGDRVERHVGASTIRITALPVTP